MDSGKLLTLGLVAGGGYLAYQWLMAPAATAAPAPPVTPTPAPGATTAGATLVPAPGSSSSTVPTTTPAPAATPAGGLADMYVSLKALAAQDAQFTGSGDSLTGTGYQWGFYLQRVLQPGTVVDLPSALYLSAVFPGVDPSAPMTASQFWASMGPAVGKQYGLSGLAGLMRGLGMLGDLPACSDVTVDPGFVGPVECTGSQSEVSYPASQQQVAALYQSLTSGAYSASPASNATSWLNQNAGTVAMVAAAGLFLAMFVGGRR